MLRCSICGGTTFRDKAVLWDGLCAEWQIGPEERAYIDRQQGTQCTDCGGNLRSIALANGILDAFNTSQLLIEWASDPRAAALAVLEINEAGFLSPILNSLSGHILARYPTVDMQSMPYADASFDLVVHSDTLEHVAEPIQALAECKRVLRPGGILAFTVPVIVGRMTRDRVGLPDSYHGDPAANAADYRVFTEYGSDMWIHTIRAGFGSVQIYTVDYPSALAMICRA